MMLGVKVAESAPALPAAAPPVCAPGPNSISKMTRNQPRSQLCLGESQTEEAMLRWMHLGENRALDPTGAVCTPASQVL